MTTPPDSVSDLPRTQRALWWAIAGGSLLLLVAATLVDPDPRGYGTHTQLGVPPCGFLMLTGSPCPGCGLTTAFAHGIRGDWGLALNSNPLGLALFLVVCASIPLAVAAALRGWPVDTVVERLALNRWALAIAGCAVVLWVVRFAAVL